MKPVIRAEPMRRAGYSPVLYGLAAVSAFLAGVAVGLGSPFNGTGPLGEGLTTWVRANLGYSVIGFAVVLLGFSAAVGRMHRALMRERLSEALAAGYQADMFSGLAFGVGVIWTAIGMRNALQSTFAQMDAEVLADAAAIDVLNRLVEGGMVLALTTTIVGGVLGYGMQLYKNLRYGYRLRALTTDAWFYDSERTHQLLERIETALKERT